MVRGFIMAAAAAAAATEGTDVRQTGWIGWLHALARIARSRTVCLSSRVETRKSSEVAAVRGTRETRDRYL
jgi:hypothetical protein